MINSFLAGFGPGLQNAQDAAARKRQQELLTLAFLEQIKSKRDENAASTGFWNAISGAGGDAGITPPSPVGGGSAPQIDMAPDSGGGFSMPSGPPAGGGAAPVGNNTPGKGRGFAVPDLYNLAVKAGYQPGEKAATAAAISMAESSGNPGAHNTKGEDSYGLMQLNAAAHGDLARTFDPLENMRRSLKVSAGGSNWSPWSVYKNGAYKQFLPEAMAAAGSGSSGPQVNGAGAPVTQGQLGGAPDAGGYGATNPSSNLQALIPPAMQKEAQQTAIKTAQAIDPTLQGKMSLQGLAKSIEKSMPNASPAAKMMALDRLQKYMAPIQQEQWRQQREMRTEQFKIEMERLRDREKNQMEGLRDREKAARDERLEEKRGWTVMTDPATGEQYAYNAQLKKATTLTGEPYTPGGAQKLGGGAGTKASRNIEITDSEGKVVFRGAAHQGPQGWIADKDNKPVQVPEDGNIRLSSTAGGPGKQAAAQLNRVIAAGNELSGAMRDLLELPSGSVAGVFQGLQAMPADSLGEAMKRSLANKLTDEAASDVKIGFQGVARFVASLEAFGAATGLVGLTKSAEVYMPQTGDTMGNVLRKYATLRRDAERALEAGAASPDVGQDQKKLIEKVRQELSQAVPFTVQDVNKLQHGDAETYRDVAKKLLGGGAAGGMPPEAVADLKKDASPERRKQFDEIFGSGASAKALGQ